MGDIEAIGESLIAGDDKKVRELTQAALDSGMDAGKILNDGLITSMAVIGERFKKEEVYLPEVLFAARAMGAGMEVLEPGLVGAGVEPIGKVILGTVEGDVHDIGKNLVGMMLKGAGFEVNDLGVDVSPEKFVEAVKEENGKIVAMSALLSTSRPSMKDTIDALDTSGLKGQVKTIVGGAIVTEGYADEIKADGYASDGATAVDRIKELLGLR